jgi:hypothetical protein
MVLAQKQIHRIWDGIADPEINPHSYSNMISIEGAKAYIGEKTVSNKWCWENWIFTCRRLKLDPIFHPV